MKINYLLTKFRNGRFINFNLTITEINLNTKNIYLTTFYSSFKRSISFKDFVLISLAYCLRFFLFCICINITNLSIKQTALIKGFNNSTITGERAG